MEDFDRGGTYCTLRIFSVHHFAKALEHVAREICVFNGAAHEYGRFRMNEWMPSFHVFYRSFFLLFFLFFFRTWPYVLWQVLADCNSLLTYIVHNTRMELNKEFSSSIEFLLRSTWPEFTTRVFNPLRFTRIFWIPHTDFALHTSRFYPKFFPIGFSTVHGRYFRRIVQKLNLSLAANTHTTYVVMASMQRTLRLTTLLVVQKWCH